MKLLNDKELTDLINDQSAPLISNWIYTGDPYAKDSPIQPASLDLHLGKIIIPGNQDGVQIGNVAELTDHCVPAGGTVVITTKEVLRMPSNIAGLVFPASRVAAQGIVITNPGHIDPGYEGLLRFTLVNVGKEHYPLKEDSVLVTAIFFEITKCSKNWKERSPATRSTISPLGLKDIAPLSRDFLNVDDRAEKKAQTLLDKWDKRTTIIAAVITALVTLFSVLLSNVWRDEIRSVKADVDGLKNKEIFQSISGRLDTLEKKLTDRTNPPLQSGISPTPNMLSGSSSNPPAPRATPTVTSTNAVIP